MRRSPAPDLSTKVAAARAALASGDLAATERLCQGLVASAPRDGRAWAMLAETALQRGRPDAALICADRAAALRPSDPISHIMVGKVAFATGDLVGALRAVERAAKIPALPAEADDALGALLSLMGRHREALARFRRAVALAPAVSQFLFNLAAAERMLGLLEEAEAHCDAVIAREPRYALAWYLRADLRTQTPARNHIAPLIAAAQARRDEWRSEVLLRYALAKEYEDLGEHAKAFDEVATAAALQKRRQPADGGAEIAEIDRIIATHTKSWFAAAPAGFAGSAPVFVVGLPRTGTTLVERIVASHSAIVSVGETGLFAATLARSRVAQPGAATAPAELGKRYGEAVAEVFATGCKRFVDKTLKNYLYCGLIRAALPNAKILLVRRHPMDAAFALYKAHFQGGFSFSYDLADLADYLLAYRRLARHWKAVLPPQALLEVHYEDIVADQAGQSRRLIDFLGLPWEDEVLRFHESAAPAATASAVQIRRPVYASSVGKWRVHAERLAPLRERLAREMAAEELA
jgi:tetratricopeptide (TPR) repeat protein